VASEMRALDPRRPENAFPAETWVLAAIAASVLVGLLTGIGIELLGKAISFDAAESGKLETAALMIGVGLGASVLIVFLTVYVASRRLVDRLNLDSPLRAGSSSSV